MMRIAIFFIAGMFAIAGCETSTNSIETEQQILEDLFPAIVNATCIDVRKYVNVPPFSNRLLIDEEGDIRILDSSLFSKDDLTSIAEWQKRADSINADTSKLIVYFNPILKPITEDLDYIKKLVHDTSLAMQQALPLSFRFKKEIVEGRFRVTTANKEQTENHLSLSRVLFNSTKTLGVIEAGFGCRGNCGKGYYIVIKKGQNRRWFISKVKKTWIA